MKTILINYRGKQISTQIKTEWNELSWSDIKFIIRNFIGNLERVYGTREEIREAKEVKVKDSVLLNAIVGGITLKLWDIKPKVLKEIPGAELDRLVDMYFPIKFLFEANNFTKCPVKRYFNWKFYYAPSDDFSTIDFEEFCYGDSQYYKYRKTRNPEDLDKFIALLMRPAGKQLNGIDKREVFMPQLIETRLKAIKNMPVEKKIALWLWWEGCRNKQAGIYKRFFRKSSSTENNGGSLFYVMLSMSKDIFGPLEQTKRVNCKVAFARMDQLLKEADDRE